MYLLSCKEKHKKALAGKNSMRQMFSNFHQLTMVAVKIRLKNGLNDKPIIN